MVQKIIMHCIAVLYGTIMLIIFNIVYSHGAINHFLVTIYLYVGRPLARSQPYHHNSDIWRLHIHTVKHVPRRQMSLLGRGSLLSASHVSHV